MKRERIAIIHYSPDEGIYWAEYQMHPPIEHDEVEKGSSFPEYYDAVWRAYNQHPKVDRVFAFTDNGLVAVPCPRSRNEPILVEFQGHLDP